MTVAIVCDMIVEIRGEPDAVRAALTGLLANRDEDFFGTLANFIQGGNPDDPNTTYPHLWLMAAPYYCETPEEQAAWQAANPNYFAAGAKGQPHWSLWEQISSEYPTVKMLVHWRVEGLWDAGTAEVQDGRVKITRRQRGYFVNPPPQPGVWHHYALDIGPDPEAARAALAGLIQPYRTEHEPYHHDAVTRQPDRVRGRLAELGYTAAEDVPDDYDGPEYQLIPYGLDEDIYLDTIDTEARSLIGEDFDVFAAIDTFPVGYLPILEAKLDVVFRSVALKAAEVKALRDIMVGQPRHLLERHTEEEAARFHADTFTAVERSLIHNAVGSGPFRPTHRMIRHLLAAKGVSPERRAELQAALNTPAWAGEAGRWPEWEKQAAEHVPSSVS
jgi:hypothetical protein